MDEPGRSIRMAHHAGVAVEPDRRAVARNDAVRRAQRLAGEEHACCFNAPALLVVGMDAVVPADGIFKPLFARVAERGLNFRAHVGLADAAIEIGHENDRRNLLEQRAILGLEIRSVGFCSRELFGVPGRCSIRRSQTRRPTRAEALRLRRDPASLGRSPIRPRAAEGGLPIRFARAVPSLLH